jgi:hypothetical protein
MDDYGGALGVTMREEYKGNAVQNGTQSLTDLCC